MHFLCHTVALGTQEKAQDHQPPKVTPVTCS